MARCAPPIDPFAQVPQVAARQDVPSGTPPSPGAMPAADQSPPPSVFVPLGPQSSSPLILGPPAGRQGPQFPAAAPNPEPQFPQQYPVGIPSPGSQPPPQYPGAMPIPGPQYPQQIPPQYPGTVPNVAPVGPPMCTLLPEDHSMVLAGSNAACRLLDHLEGNVVARAYYANDQRLEWSGMEASFGAEAVLTPRLRERCGDFEFIIDSELNINEPFDGNQLLDTPERQSYAANFQVSQFDISQLALVTKYHDWTFKAGKFVTPFGRFYFPLYTNSYWDSPFIRTEAINWRETGLSAHYQSGYFVADLALTNGGTNRATNSGRAGIVRAGLESDWWAIGISAKQGYGVGSEQDKEFNTYYGVDMMVRSGPFQLSAECIYDEYGFGRPGLDPNNITWVKSTYYRDVSSGFESTPCTGIGYYVNLGYVDPFWNVTVNYGDFYPLFTGTAPNQRVEHRGLVKAAYQLAKPLQVYSMVIVENGWYVAQVGEERIPFAVLCGCQLTF